MSSLFKSKVEPGDVRFIVKSRSDIVDDVVVVLDAQDCVFHYTVSETCREVTVLKVLSEGRILSGLWFRDKTSEALKTSDLVLSETVF